VAGGMGERLLDGKPVSAVHPVQTGSHKWFRSTVQFSNLAVRTVRSALSFELLCTIGRSGCKIGVWLDVHVMLVDQARWSGRSLHLLCSDSLMTYPLVLGDTAELKYSYSFSVIRRAVRGYGLARPKCNTRKRRKRNVHSSPTPVCRLKEHQTVQVPLP
jgi:hypothetical protein